MKAIDFIVSMFVLIFFVLWLISKFRKKTITDTLDDIADFINK